MFGWGFLATFFFFAGIGAVLGLLWAFIKTFPALLAGFIEFLKGVLLVFKGFGELGNAFIEGAREEWNRADLDGKPKNQ